MVTQLNEISPASWEHPADRAALGALGKIPGLDSVLRKIIGIFGESNIRMMYQANSIRVTPTQYTDIHDSLVRVCSTLDTNVPPLYITQSPMVNAGAVGVDEPVIVLQSSLIEVLTPEGVEAVLGHEVGHIMSDHALYRTMLNLLLSLSAARSPLIGAAGVPIVLALREWNRKAELSCDRAGLLAVQDFDVSIGALAAMAGGIRGRNGEIDTDAFIEQSEEYLDAEGLSQFYKMTAMLGRTHPYVLARVAELRKWVGSGEYHAIIGGEYIRRGEEGDALEDVGRAGKYYTESATNVFENVEGYISRTLGGIADRMDQAYNAGFSGYEPSSAESDDADSGPGGASTSDGKGVDGDPDIDWGDWPEPLI